MGRGIKERNVSYLSENILSSSICGDCNDKVLGKNKSYVSASIKKKEQIYTV